MNARARTNLVIGGGLLLLLLLAGAAETGATDLLASLAFMAPPALLATAALAKASLLVTIKQAALLMIGLYALIAFCIAWHGLPGRDRDGAE